MFKKFNMLALIIILVFQTMIAPVAVTAQGVEQETDDNTVTTEDVSSTDEAEASEETESTENDADGTEVDEKEPAEEPEGTDADGVSEVDSELGDGTDVSEEGAEKESVITDADETVTNEPVEVDKNTDKVTPFAALTENLIKSFELTLNPGPNEEVIQNGEIKEVNLDEMNAIALNYTLIKPDEVTVEAGDTYTIDLPDIFKDAGATVRSIEIGGITVGSFVIENNQVVITFTDEIEGFDNAEMNVNITGEFNTEVFEQEQEIEVEVPYREGTGFSFTIRAEQQDYSGEDKKTVGEQYVKNGEEKVTVDRNPEYIDWTVLANDSMGSFENATIIDDLDENLEIVEDSFKVERIIRNYRNEEVGRETVNVTPTITDAGFELSLGEIDDAYEISYTTRVIRPDGGGTHTINNNARIILDGDDNPVSDSFEGTWSGDIPTITKDGDISENREDIINWIVEYNFGKEPLGEVTLTDSLTHGEVDLDSVVVLQVETDIDGNVVGEGTVVDVTPVPTENGMTLPDLDADGKAYLITFSSSVPVGLNDTVVNTISDDFPNPNTDDADVPVNTIPTGGKVGEQDVDDDGRPYIEWTITMNSQKADVGSIDITDVFDPKYLEFDVNNEGLFQLYSDGEEADNFIISKYDHEDDRTGFTLNIQNAGPHTYEFVYRTYYTVEGMQEPELANHAELIFRDGEGAGVGDPINIDVDQEGPKAGINKSGNYVRAEDNTEQQIEWTVTFNSSNILLNAGTTLTDNFVSGNYTYIDGSIDVTGIEEQDYTFTPNTDDSGFVLTLNEETKATITVTFKTTTDDENQNNAEHENEAILKWQGGEEKAEAEVGVRHPRVNKSGNVVINEDGSKTVNWTINFNTDANIIHDFKLIDTYTPASVTVSDIKVTSGETDETDQFTISVPTDGEFTVSKDKLDAVPYQLTYSTTLSPEEEAEEVKNTAEITYTGGEDEAEDTIPSPTLGVQKEAVGHVEKTETGHLINWKITANTDTAKHLVNLVNPVLTDTIPEDQRLVFDSIKVERVVNDDNVDITDLLISSDPSEIVEEDNEFTINLPDGTYQYIVTFQTEILEFPSVNEKIDRYTNETKLSNDGHEDVSDDAYIDYFADGTNNNNAKTGEVNDDTENIDWEATVNPLGLTINNAVITDELSDNQSYLIDKNHEIVVKDSDDNVLEEGDTADYTLVMGAGNRSFTITFNDQINESITVSYSTRLDPELIGNITVSNTVKLTGGENKRELSSFTESESTSQWTYGGGGSGRTLEFTLNKETPGGDAVPNATFDFLRITASGNEVPTGDTGITTGADGKFEITNARAGRYKVTETSTPDGYVALTDPIYMIIGYANPADLESGDSEYIIQITDSNWESMSSDVAQGAGDQLTIINEYKPVSVALEATKTLEGNKPLEAEQFTFELLQDGEVIGSQTNDADGNIVFKELEELTYNTTGTFEYQIREVEGSLSGVTYDEEIFNVTVTVTRDEQGRLITSISYEDNTTPKFINLYEADPVSVNFKAEKILEGLNLTDNQFEFELVDESKEAIQTVTNNADGEVVFEEINYNAEGTHTYIIREVKSELGGVTSDPKEYVVAVIVKDNLEGELVANVNYMNGPAVFTNTYTPEPDSVVFEASKILEGQKLEDNQFEFELVDADGEVLQKVLNNAGGQVIFEEIIYNETGDHTYKIREVQGDLGGVTYDNKEFTFEVTVEDNKEGELVAEVREVNGPAVFANLYETEPDSLVFEGEKRLEGQTLVNGQFEFELVNEEGTVLETVSNNAEGQIIFSEITYDEIGEHKYTIREVEGVQGGVTYDETVYAVEVSVEDNGEGQLIATTNYVDGPVSFTNIYEAEPDSVVIEAFKVLEGQTLVNKQFEFELVDEEGHVLEKVSNNGEGQVIFSEITYNTASEHTYTIREVQGSQGGVTYDTNVFTVTVTAVDNGEGQLIATPVYSSEEVVFTNTYEAEPDSVVIEAHKVLEGKDLVAGQFTFELVDEDDNILQTTNNRLGQVIFAEIEFDTVGEYEYTIREVEGIQGGITYDSNLFIVTVTVEDDGVGNLVATPIYSSEEVVFTNTYSAAVVEVGLIANKNLNGQVMEEGQFNFELVEDNDVIQTVSNESDGTVTFEKIPYEEVGTYYYQIREVQGTQGGMTYDTETFNVVVNVTDDGEGQLVADERYLDGPATFTNTYVAEPTEIVLKATKVLEGQNLEVDQFEFELVDSEGEVLQTVENTVDGKVTFEKITYEYADIGTYEYTIREVKGSQGGMTYDPAEYNVTVEVVDGREGQIVATVEIEEGPAEFTNTYVAEPAVVVLEATKELEGQNLATGQFEFELVDSEGEVLQTVENSADGAVIFAEIIYEYADIGTYEYTIREVKGSQGGMTYDPTEYNVTVKVSDDREGQIVATVEIEDGPIAFTNTYEAKPVTVDLEAGKVLEGRHTDLNENEFDFEVVDSEGDVVAKGTNSSDGNIAFETIEYTEVGAHEYTIREVFGEDQNIQYDTAEFEVTVIVTDNGVGQLESEVSYGEEPVFTNEYDPLKVSVGDYVWIDENKDGLQDETDTPLEGVVLVLKDHDGNLITEDVYGNPIEPQVTDKNGYYSFDDLYADHTYVVEIDREASEKALEGLEPTLEEVGQDNSVDSSTWEATSRHLTDDGDRDPTLDFGFIRPSVSVGDYVWIDENKDGLQDDTDTPLEGVVLTIEDEEGNPVTDIYGNPVGPTTTDENGYYIFDNLPIDHTYTVRIDQEASAEALKGYLPTLHEVGDDRAIDSSTWESISRHLTENGEHDPTLDFGFVKELIEVTGTKTWVDADNEADTRPGSITVNLLANGKQIDSIEVTEADDWNYSFTGLAKYEAGEEIEYSVTEVKVEGYETSINGYDITNTLVPVENPEEPEDPELGGDDGEKDPEDPTDLDAAGGEGDNLPKTATNIYNLALIGFGLMLFGLILFLVRRKRIE